MEINLGQAIKVLEEMFEHDALGIMITVSDEQEAAIKLAYNALKEPECMSCGYCQKFVDEDMSGNGWCEEHDRPANCDDRPCLKYI